MSKRLVDCPNLIKEWDYDKNKNLDPKSLSFSSHKEVFWKCKLGHSWKATIKNRTKGTGCPVCSGKIILKGFNDFGSLYPDLLKEWSFDLNKEDPYQIACHSNKKYYWRCEKGHVWDDIINHRTSRNSKCPYCQNKRVLKGFNDFLSLYPGLADEWDQEKNSLKPDEVTAGSGRTVWWKCPNGHDSYKASIVNRRHGSGCHVCNTMLQTSFPEQAILFYIKKLFPDSLNKYKKLFNSSMELDIFIPSKRIAIEYDGLAWHNTEKSKKREETKYRICKDNNIFLYRIREESTDCENADKLFTIPAFSYDNCSPLNGVIKSIIEDISDDSNLMVDIQNDILEILKYRIIKLEDSLAFLYPDISKEWHPSLNNGLKPENVLPGTSLKVWWRCSKGHEWKGSVVTRTKGHGCDICAREQRKITYHSVRLQTRKLLIGCDCVLDWDYTKNNHGPEYYTKGSGEKVWWKCHKCGHEWKTAICNRTRDYKNGCPACSNRIVVKGKNDIQTTNPELMKEWDWELNKGIDPSTVAQWSHEKYWWKCSKCGYQYQSTPSNRVYGKGCGCCAGRIVVPGINDLATTRPDIAIDWHPSKNGTLKPTDVTKGRRDMVWWKCHVCGHEWQDTLTHRNGGRGCSICNKRNKHRK